jgi:hypothetical protein
MGMYILNPKHTVAAAKSIFLYNYISTKMGHNRHHAENEKRIIWVKSWII